MSVDVELRKFLAIQPRPPAPPEEENLPGETKKHEAGQAPRRLQIHTACDSCRSRKVKCDGKRLQCTPCLRKTLNCVYGPDPKMTREAMGAEIRTLRDELEAERESRRAASVVALGAPSTTLQAGILMDDPFGVENICKSLQANIAVIEETFIYFNCCSEFLFYSYSPHDAVALMDCIREDSQLLTRSLLCQACAMAAVGACFSRGKIPAKLGDFFYNVAKMFLDDCVETDPRSAIKVCALLAARNIMLKATVALAYIELGLGISRNLGLYVGQAPPLISSEEWIEQKRIWRCLLTLQFWLQTTLGWTPGPLETPHELTWRDIELQTPRDLDDTEFFQQSMARIAIQKHKLLQILPATENVPMSHFAALKISLQQWYDALPAEAQISNTIDAPVSSATRFKLYYLHLSHLGAKLLLFRCLIRRHDLPPQDGTSPSALANWVDEGLLTVRQSARISYLMYIEGGSVRHCWLCIFQAYVACCLLLHLCFQKTLRNIMDPEWDEDVALAKKMLEVLKYCSELDGIARHFHSTVVTYLTSLEEAVGKQQSSQLANASQQDHRESSNGAEFTPILAPVAGSTKHHTVANELFKLVAWPFGEQEVEARHMLVNHEEVSLGVHAEWVAELSATYGPEGPRTSSRTSSAIVSQRLGDFVGSPMPSGWAASRSFQSYQEGASTLDFSPPDPKQVGS